LNVELPHKIGCRSRLPAKPQGNQTPAPISFVVLLLSVTASVDLIGTLFSTVQKQLSRLINVNGLLGMIPRTRCSVRRTLSEITEQIAKCHELTPDVRRIFRLIRCLTILMRCGRWR
jgi:hypothetical protein